MSFNNKLNGGMIHMKTVQIKEINNENPITIFPPRYEVTDFGIEKVIKENDDGTYVSKIVLPKEIIIEAFHKYINEPRTGKKRTTK